MVFLYTYRSTLNYHQRKFLLKQMGTNPKWEQDSLARHGEMERLGTLSPKLDISIKSLPSEHRELFRREDRQSLIVRRDGEH